MTWGLARPFLASVVLIGLGVYLRAHERERGIRLGDA